MKILFLYMSFILIPVLLIACQSNSDTHSSTEEISKVSLSNSNGIGELNTDFFAIYEDEEALGVFQNMLDNVVKQESIVDVSDPEFDLEVIYKEDNREGYHLWLGEQNEKSTLMNVEDTNTTYSLSKEITNRLIELIQ